MLTYLQLCPLRGRLAQRQFDGQDTHDRLRVDRRELETFTQHSSEGGREGGGRERGGREGEREREREGGREGGREGEGGGREGGRERERGEGGNNVCYGCTALPCYLLALMYISNAVV